MGCRSNSSIPNRHPTANGEPTRRTPHDPRKKLIEVDLPLGAIDVSRRCTFAVVVMDCTQTGTAPAPVTAQLEELLARAAPPQQAHDGS
jgi:hypothetical protein